LKHLRKGLFQIFQEYFSRITHEGFAFLRLKANPETKRLAQENSKARQNKKIQEVVVLGSKLLLMGKGYQRWKFKCV
jgi:hypothetical protein